MLLQILSSYVYNQRKDRRPFACEGAPDGMGTKKKGISMKKMKNRLTAIAAVAFATVLACGVLAGCSSDKG